MLPHFCQDVARDCFKVEEKKIGIMPTTFINLATPLSVSTRCFFYKDPLCKEPTCRPPEYLRNLYY